MIREKTVLAKHLYSLVKPIGFDKFLFVYW